MINVTKTYLPDLDKYQAYVKEIFESGYLTNNGRFVQELQKRLSDFLGVQNLLLVSNGTMALQISYKLLGLSGDVLTTPFSFVATTSSLVWEGLNPVFVDIDSETLNIDVRKIEDRITQKTSAIVATHVYGNVCDIETIEEIAQRKGLKVIYDAAHAFDVKYRNRSLLNAGDISILSFHSTKVYHTIEGGAIAIRDSDLYEQAQRMINFGIAGPGCVAGLGINAKMNEFEAAMGLCLLDDFEIICSRRKEVWLHYTKKLENVPHIRFPRFNPHATNNYGYFPIIFESEGKLIEVLEKLYERKISPRRYFNPSLDTLSYITKGEPAVISRQISKCVLCLPMYESLPRDVQDEIIHTVLDCVS